MRRFARNLPNQPSRLEWGRLHEVCGILLALSLWATVGAAGELSSLSSGRTSSGEPAVGAVDVPLSAAPVADAARAGDEDLVRNLLRAGADVNAAHGDGFTALHWAALQNDAAIAEMALYAGARTEARTRIGAHTPLMVAAKVGNVRVLGLLLDAGASVDAATSNGTTALMLAGAVGEPEAVKMLVEAGASLWSREGANGQTPLHFAAAQGRTEAVELLLRSGAEHCATTNIFDAVASENAIRGKMIEKYRRGREKETAAKEEGDDAAPAAGGANASADRKKAELASNRPGADAPKAKRSWFRRKKADTAVATPPRPLSFGQLVGKAGGMTALHYAARGGHRDTVAVLLDNGADINHVADGDRSTPLLVATMNGHFDLAADLLDRGADPNLASVAGATPLYAAVNVFWAPHAFYPQPTDQYQQNATLYSLLQALLDAGADPNARLKKKVWYTGYNFDQSGIDETGATAFWRAAQAADVEAMKLLVAGGADWTIPTIVVPERRSPNGRNADKDLEKAAPQLGDPAVSPFLVATGAGYVGNFHRVEPGGFLRASRYFIEELGADVNASDAKGQTALHNAAMRGDTQMIVYYVLHGADPHVVTRAGDNVADLANGPVQRIQPFPETLKLLAALGVQHNDRCVSC